MHLYIIEGEAWNAGGIGTKIMGFVSGYKAKQLKRQIYVQGRNKTMNGSIYYQKRKYVQGRNETINENIYYQKRNIFRAETK